jgi:hypothetical protein
MVPIPWQQFSNLALRHICDASEHVGQPSLWIDVIELGRPGEKPAPKPTTMRTGRVG